MIKSVATIANPIPIRMNQIIASIVISLPSFLCMSVFAILS